MSVKQKAATAMFCVLTSIEELARWRLTVQEIIATAKDTDSSALKSAICLGIGSRPEDDLTIDEKATAEFLARTARATDATTHLAARWLLRKMAVPVPMEDSWHVKQSDRGWFLSHRNSVLIRIQPPPERTQFLLQGVTVLSPSHQYWIAAEEVSRGDFEACLADSEYHKTDTDLIKRFTAEVGTSAARASQLYSPTPEHPAQDISWYDALRYCNWLSTRDGLIPVYRFRGRQIELQDGGLQVETRNWEVDPTGNGYRLPTTEEWIYACRAGSQTAWTCGPDPGVLSAWCRMQPSEVTSICGIRLPNAWGLHDVHGNVQEWCHSTDPTGRLRRICGGSKGFSH
jgi:formylglycine-generating enzyme required for sulfatase activity